MQGNNTSNCGSNPFKGINSERKEEKTIIPANPIKQVMQKWI
jgi:hypothetical protein